MVEGARLESVYTGNRIAGSNPALSARNIINSIFKHSYFRHNDPIKVRIPPHTQSIFSSEF